MTLLARVTSVVAVRPCDLTDEQARRDGFESLAELHKTLDMHCPGLGSEDMTDVATSELQ